MKKFWIQIVFLLIIIFGALFVTYNKNIVPPFSGTSSTAAARQIKVGNTVINIEIADTPQARSKGLGGRDALAADFGMLFIFPEEKKYQFWMKDMKISLDFIFIQKGKVVDVLKNVQPPLPNQKDNTLPVYEPVAPINMMLEVNAGFVDAHGIRAGDQVYLIQ